MNKSNIVESERLYQHDFYASDARKYSNHNNFGPASPLSSSSRYGHNF